MNDLEELVRDGIERLTAESRIPDGLAGRARRRVAQRRHWMRAAAAAGAAVTAAATAIAVTAVASPGHQPAARLAAWTVVRQADGDITVTISQLHDPAGLQSTLNADGVPASVTFLHQQNPACTQYPGGQALLGSIVTGQLQDNTGQALTIDPSALPGGAGLQIAATNSPDSPGPGYWINTRLIQASQQCTGS